MKMQNVKVTWKNTDTGESETTHLVQFVPYTMLNGEIRQTVEMIGEDGEVEEIVESFWIFNGGSITSSSAPVAEAAAAAEAS